MKNGSRRTISSRQLEKRFDVSRDKSVPSTPSWVCRWFLVKKARCVSSTLAKRGARLPSVFVKNKLMVDRKNIQIDLIKLVSGERLLRLTEPQSGLALEKKLDPQKPVASQKEKLFAVFEAALARAELATA